MPRREMQDARGQCAYFTRTLSPAPQRTDYQSACPTPVQKEEAIWPSDWLEPST
jgi:hypothetical protein